MTNLRQIRVPFVDSLKNRGSMVCMHGVMQDLYHWQYNKVSSHILAAAWISLKFKFRQ